MFTSVILALAVVPTATAWTSAVARRPLRVTPVAVAAGGENKALIIQNKGGGHGELGFQLAKVLKEEKKQISLLLP